MKIYILQNGDYFLSDYNIDEYYVSDIDIFKYYLQDFTVSRDLRKLFYDIEKAEEIRRLIYIETGLNFTIRIFKEREEEI